MMIEPRNKELCTTYGSPTPLSRDKPQLPPLNLSSWALLSQAKATTLREIQQSCRTRPKA
jgi:hypothetical protein